jgi:hypothetical protein
VTFVTAPDCRADTLSVVRYPAGVEDAAFRKEMASRRVVVAGSLGPLAGKAFRMGHARTSAESGDGPHRRRGELRALGARVGAAVTAAAGTCPEERPAKPARRNSARQEIDQDDVGVSR